MRCNSLANIWESVILESIIIRERVYIIMEGIDWEIDEKDVIDGSDKN